MARPINRLSARTVATAPAGYHADGGGLYLLVSPTGSRSWVLRYQLNGRRREMGLGSAALYGLADARQRALEARRLLADGIDPITARASARAATGRTWGQAVDAFIESHRHGWKNDAQADQWRQSLRDHGPDPALPVAAIDTALVLNTLRRIWTTKTETAARVRGRIERVWDAERVAGTVAGDNPAQWRGHLDKLLPKPAKVAKVRHFAAMPYADAPAFWQSLGQRKGLARDALRFTILTAARTGEVTGLSASEIDGDLWTVPGERMKAGREHTVPLVPAALEILARHPNGFPLSANGMLALLQRPPPKGYGLPYTVHGFRSTFRDWAAETTAFPGDVVEMALAHTIRDKTEAAYRRGQLLTKRRELMEAWADYLQS